MLRKLLKQEFRATARVMLPLYLVTFVLALAVRLVLLLSQNQVLLDSVGGRTLRAILLGVSVTAFVVATIATFLAALIQAVLRFRSNLLGDEGYVMFTLPVSTHQLVWAKLITSVVWFLGAAVIDVLALLALVVNLGMFQEFGRFVIEVKEQLTAYLVGNGIAFLVELALLFVVGCLVLCLNFYAPLAIGHSFALHKLLWSVVFFFAIQIVIQIIGGVFGLIALPHLWSVNFNFMTAAAAAHAMMWSSILVTAIYGAILYGVTLYMLRKRLNLE